MPVALLALVAVAAADRPNIVLILSDDMGFSDLGCYGSEIETPHLDSLAAGGLRLTQFYNTGRCCPTRASLLTGLYPHAAGVGHMMENRGHDGYRGNLSPQSVTIAEALRGSGYATAMAGKWHVTRHVLPDEPKFNWPVQRGFDRFYGMVSGAGSFWDPWTLTRDNTRISAFADPDYDPAKSPAGAPYYFTDAVTDHAVRFITEHHEAAPQQPQFLYVAYTAAHWPMHARERDIAKYRGRYDGGFEPIRQARFAKMKRLGLIAADAELSPQAVDWADADQESDAELMAIYAAMVDSMDQGIGRILATLDETGRRDDTLIFFCQDNGGCAEGFGRDPGRRSSIVAGPRPSQPTLSPLPDDAFIGAMVPPQTRDGYPIRGGVHATSGGPDTYIAYGEGWANVSNTPFRLYKHYVHEGGIATPLIANWPAGLTGGGRLDATPSHLVDIMATCLDVAGAEFPTQRDGVATRRPVGVSLRPLFGGGELEPRSLYWEHEENRAIRQGRWKLVSKGPKRRGDDPPPWELYDMQTDRSELHDLAGEQPDRVAAMAADWDAWANRDQVRPVGGWRLPKQADAPQNKAAAASR